MTPRQLIELSEARDLMQTGEYKQALEKLNWLADKFPDDQQVQALIRTCRLQSSNHTKDGPQEVIIRFKSLSNMAFILFIVITLSIVAAWYIIFYAFSFTLKIRPAEIQYYLAAIITGH